MKFNSSLFTLLVTAAVGMTFTACSNGDDLATASQETQTIDLTPATSSKIMVTSGDYILRTSTGISSRSDDGSLAGFTWYKVQDRVNDNETAKEGSFAEYWKFGDNAPATTDRQEQVSQSEYETVIKYIAEHPDEGGTYCDLVNYFIQNVGSSFDTYTSEPDQNGASQSVTGGNKMDYCVLNGNHITDFNAVNGPRELILNCPVTGGEGPQYHGSYGNNTVSNEYKFVYIDGDGDGNLDCYLCFDYAEDSQNGNVKPDGVYNDWVIKLVPADGSTGGSHAKIKKDNPDPTDDPTDPTDDPTTPTVVKGNVEINLALNEEKEEGDYIASKLSIHVRDTSDVEVFIPVPMDYYCNVDDMNILKNHDNFVYNEGNESVSMVIAGQTVTLTCTYSADGITVKTQGINAAVLKELRDTFGDGLNFEVWNYYFTDPEKKWAIKRSELQSGCLNNSTVKFTNTIGEYINTINNNDTYTLDCVVKRID